MPSYDERLRGDAALGNKNESEVDRLKRDGIRYTAVDALPTRKPGTDLRCERCGVMEAARWEIRVNGLVLCGSCVEAEEARD